LQSGSAAAGHLVTETSTLLIDQTNTLNAPEDKRLPFHGTRAAANALNNSTNCPLGSVAG
jgi:hypothetical protein